MFQAGIRFLKKFFPFPEILYKLFYEKEILSKRFEVFALGKRFGGGAPSLFLF